jgi:uroporphyrinogen decarboxylase
MTPRENLLSLLRRRGFERVPVEFRLTGALREALREELGPELDIEAYFGIPWRYVRDGIVPAPGPDPHWPPSAASVVHPLRAARDPEEIAAYPFPDFAHADFSHQAREVERIHAEGLAAVGSMQQTVWETAWYLRGMEELMIDMVGDDPAAELLLDKITEIAVLRAEAYARAGVDILYLGDDVGTQRSLLMGRSLYAAWLKPRLARVIAAAKAVKPDLIVFYHSCGYVTPLIPDFIEIGVDVLNPIQSECMDFAAIHAEYGERLSFHGTIGTQSTLPFGSPGEVRREVLRNLEAAGASGGLMVAPTHTLTADVPWANVLAYVRACGEFG